MKKSNVSAWLGGSLLPLLLCPGVAPNAHAGGGEFALCAKKHPDNDAERLKCYDNALSAPAAQVPLQPAASAPQDDDEYAAPATGSAPVAERSYLTRAWNLDDRTSHDESKLGRLVPHRLNYLLVRKTFNVNNRPVSPAPANSTIIPNDIDALETKFQLSFKKDIGSQQDIDFWGFKTLRVWGAYTQQSNWQVINTRNSSPFRETNYEPELIATFGTRNFSGLKLVNLGLVHQSNGQNLPWSRSWNRLYLQGGWEWSNSTSILARGWWRIPENFLKDDNSDIADYVGRADLVARWEPADKSQALAVQLRNNLRWAQNRSFVQIDWSMPIALGNAVRVHAQVTSGYGESLIDYNYRQTTLGLGFSFREW